MVPRRSSRAAPPGGLPRVPRGARGRESGGPRSRRSRCSSCRRRRSAASLRRAPQKRASRRLPGTPARVNSRHRATPVSPGRKARSIVSRQRGRLEIVVFARRDPRPHKASRSRTSTVLQIRDAVDIICLPFHASNTWLIHEHVDVAPDEPRQSLGRNRTLYLDDFFQTISLDAVFDVVFILHRSRALLRRVRKRAHAIELRFLEESEQRPEILLRLARESHEAGRADRQIGNGAAQPRELLPQRAQPLREKLT